MCNNSPAGQKLKITTTEGDIYVVLYDDTPIHKKNFIKKIESGVYQGAPFHRIIRDFMIQAGEVHKSEEQSIDDQLPEEINFHRHFHKHGAIAAARWGDEVNPDKKSDPIQFYIVTGCKQTKSELAILEKERYERLKQKIYREYQSVSVDSIKHLYKEGKKDEIIRLRASILEQATQAAEEKRTDIMYGEDQKKIYEEKGGAPHLDGDYTVFGEVYKGMDVVMKIENTETNMADRPIKNVVIKRIELL